MYIVRHLVYCKRAAEDHSSIPLPRRLFGFYDCRTDRVLCRIHVDDFETASWS